MCDFGINIDDKFVTHRLNMRNLLIFWRNQAIIYKVM